MINKVLKQHLKKKKETPCLPSPLPPPEKKKDSPPQTQDGFKFD